MDELLEALKAGILALHDIQKQDPVLRTDMELAIRIFNIEEAYGMLANRVEFLKYAEGETRDSLQSKEP